MPTTQKNILILTYWSFNDALIQTYTLPYVKLISKHLPAGSVIYLFTLEQPRVAITPEQQALAEEKLSAYNIKLLPFRYQRFGAKAIFGLSLAILKMVGLCFAKNIYALHTWCTPGGAIGYLISILTGKPLILDSYEPHAELMAESNTWARTGKAFQILFTLEKLQTYRAKYIIAVNEAMIGYAKNAYHATIKNYFIKPACVDFSLFSKENLKVADLMQKFDLDGKIVCVYAGKFSGIYLENETFDFFKTAQDFWKHRFRLVLLSSHTPEEIAEYCQKSGFNATALIHLFVPHAQVPMYMGLGDFAICPMKPIPTRRYSAPIKTGEYMAMGLPIVITENIADDSALIENENIGAVIKKFDKEGYLNVVNKIDELLTTYTREELYQKIRAIAFERKNFDIADAIYRKIYGA